MTLAAMTRVCHRLYTSGVADITALRRDIDALHGTGG
jgi:hypothetical protein